MGLENKNKFSFKGLELLNTYHVVRKSVISITVRREVVDVYASYDSFEAGEFPLTTIMIRTIIDDDADDIIDGSYAKLKERSEYSNIIEKKSNKEKSINKKNKEE